MARDALKEMWREASKRCYLKHKDAVQARQAYYRFWESVFDLQQ